jgi:hypothetical protein
MKPDAAVTARRHADRQSDQLFGFLVEDAILRGRLRHGGKACHCVRDIFAQRFDVGRNARGDFWVIFGHETHLNAVPGFTPNALKIIAAGQKPVNAA